MTPPTTVRSPNTIQWEMPPPTHRRTSVLAEGLLAGLAGAAAVALWFLVYDVLFAEPFRTPAMLGAALLKGIDTPEAVVVTAPLVLQYTALHVALFVLFGWASAGLFAIADREPRFNYMVFALFCSFQVVAFAAIAIMARWVLGAVAWYLFVGANLIGTAAMLWVFSRHHRIAVWRSDVMPTGPGPQGRAAR
jgi:hypothetical protein